MKRISLSIIGILLGTLGLIGGCVFVTNFQHSQDRKVLQDFVKENPALRSLGLESKGIRESCVLSNGSAGKCQAVLYAVTQEQCVKIIKALELQPKNEECRASQIANYQGHEVRIYFGGTYDAPGTYVTIRLNEKALFWKYW